MSDDRSDDTEDKQTKPHLYKPGQTGNPKGRPKGSKSKLSEEFLTDLLASWREKGRQALSVAADEKPVEYAKMVASLIPKEITFKNELSEFTDEQLDALAALTEAILRDGAGAGSEDIEGAGSSARH